MSGDGVIVQRDGPVAQVTLDRPEVLNRFEGTMREDLLATLVDAAEDDSVRCVRITGTGDAFSAGADLNDMIELHRSGDLDEIRRRVELGGQIVTTIGAMDKPVVAVVDGPAAGAGACLALACDIRIASTRARFVQSFVQIGLMPDWGGTRSLVELVGRGTATHLMMTGEQLDAQRAHDLGIVQLVVPTEELAEASAAYCHDLARRPQLAIAAIKEAIRLGALDALDATVAFETDAQPALFATDDCLLAMERFVQRSSR